MVEVLQAYERSEQIECRQQKGNSDFPWVKVTYPSWSFDCLDYRIAPKKQELSLVDALRTLNPQFYSEWKDLAARAAYRIEELESDKGSAR